MRWCGVLVLLSTACAGRPPAEPPLRPAPAARVARAAAAPRYEDELAQACRAGQRRACTHRALVPGTEVALQQYWFDQGCALHDGFACFELGVLRHDAKLMDEGKERIQIECQADDWEACSRSTDSQQLQLACAHGFQGSCVQPDLDECGGLPESCTRLAFEYEQGKGVAQDYAKAAHLYVKACDHQSALGCDGLGYLHEHGLGRAADYKRAVDLYQMSCALPEEERKGCYDLGRLTRDGLGTPRDDREAFRLFRKTCDDEEGVGNLGCDALAEMYDKGQIAASDLARAIHLYEHSCEGGDMKGCADLARHYELGRGVPQDFGRVTRLRARSCEGGFAPACVSLGYMKLNGDKVVKDAEVAAELFRKACDLGLQAGCEALARQQAGVVPWGQKKHP